MRHAITKLAHLHLPATEQSADRLRRMGERPDMVRVVGSPAVDGLDAIPAMDEQAFAALDAPEAVLLMHPIGRTPEAEEHAAWSILEALQGRRVLAMHPNLDPGREGILRAIESANPPVHVVKHLPRDAWVGLLKRLAMTGGVLIGNSSAGLIEASVLTVPVLNIGRRQPGRESGTNVISTDSESTAAIRDSLLRVRALDRATMVHPFGDGRTGSRVADILASVDPNEPTLTRKRCVY